MKKFKLWIFFGVVLIVFGVAGMVLNEFALPGLSTGSDGIVFAEGRGVSYEEAQQLYNQANQALADNRYDEAIELYNQIDDAYIRLQPLIWIHQADAYGQLGDEAKAQQLLQKVAERYPQSVFETIAQYELGQSAIRANQPEVARNAFKAILKYTPQSHLSLGSHYYLGELALEQDNFEAAARHWRRYLAGSPDGTFSLNAAKGLNRLPGQKTPEDYLLIGQVWFEQGRWQESADHLKKAPFEDAWVTLGRAMIRAGQVQPGLQVLERGLKITTVQQDAEQAVKSILGSYSATAQKKAKLKQLLAAQPKTGGDFILWQLRELSSGAEDIAYGQQLLTRYPKSNWAPETSWSVMWHHYKQGKSDIFLTQANRHLEEYPYSVSAPKVMFWKAKTFLKQGKQDLAHEVLESLAQTYPNQYYAFRAQQLLSGNGNPWTTSMNQSYPPTEQLEPDPEALARYIQNKNLVPTMVELIKIQNSADITLVLQAMFDKEPPAPLVSLAYRYQQEYPKSIRIIRDYLDEQRKAGNAEHNPDVRKLLFPVVYTEEINRYAQKNRLDPFLVQALMRQESYFNPLAVSSSRAMGLMQLLPSTAQGVAQWEGLKGFQAPSLFNPEINVKLGTRYLRYLHDTFRGNSMFSVGGYNGGPGAMGRWVKSLPGATSDPDLFVESIPYDQTRDYIKEVFSHYWNYQKLYQS